MLSLKIKPPIPMALLLCLECVYVQANPFYDFRSQSVNLARDLAGLEFFLSQCPCEKSIPGYFALTPCYTHTYDGRHIAKCLFGSSIVQDCGDPRILIQGSLVPDRDPQAWLADYFGLPTDFNGNISMNPVFSTFLVDCAGYVDLNAVSQGLYLSIHAPLVYTKWDLAMQESSSKGSNGYNPGYFNALPTDTPGMYRGASNRELLSRAFAFLAEGKVADLGPSTTIEPLCCSKFISGDCNNTRLGVADILAEIGCNIICSSDYRAGISVRTSFPVGNKPRFTTILEPVIGSAGHYKLGAGASLYLSLWKHQDETTEISFHLDGYGQHLFATTQEHCFDLCGKENSRYMLAMLLSQNRGTPSLTGLCDAKVEFQNTYAPVANLTRTFVKVSVALEAEFLATCVFRRNNFSCTLGYNYWMRTCHRIALKNRCNPLRIERDYWALKGDAYVIGFEDITNNPVRLAATESQATIQVGTNQNTTQFTNNNVDNPCLTDVKSEPNGVQDTHTSKPPVIIRISDINFSGTQGASNAFSIHLDHSWDLCKGLECHLGVGAQIEFSSNTICNDPCCQPCNSCSSDSSICDMCALDQWSVWLKGSVNFY